VDTSVIVFPFVNLTTLAEYNEVAQGFSSELVRQLRATEGLAVYGARPSRQAAKSRLVNSAFSIDGSLGRGRDLSLSVRLFENEHNTVIWERTFEGKGEEFLKWQQDIVGNLLHAIVRWSGLRMRAPELAGWPARVAQAPLDWFLRPQFASPPDPPTANPAAYEPYLRASGVSTAHPFGALFEAERQLQEALSLDPGFVLAHTALANNQLALLDSGVRQPSELIGRARSHAEKAVDLQGKHAETLTALGAVRQALLDWDGATEAYRRALGVDPRYAPAMRGQAAVLRAAGRVDDCARVSRLALDKDPYDERTHAQWADCFFLSGKPLIAIQQLETAVALGGAARSRYSLVRMYVYLLRTSSGAEKDLYSHKATKELANLRKAESDLWSGIDRPPILRYSDHADALFKAASGDRDGADAVRNALQRANSAGHISAFELAELAAAMGDENETLRLLETAVEKHEWQLLRLNSSPFFNDLRATPQFRTVAGKVGLAK
jgi:tetratricopeptide (TPR) repeat protein/TolB-like protein